MPLRPQTLDGAAVCEYNRYVDIYETDGNRIMDVKVNFWLDAELRAAVMDKAKRESINLSALLRAMLREWLDGVYSPTAIEKEDDGASLG